MKFTEISKRRGVNVPGGFCDKRLSVVPAGPVLKLASRRAALLCRRKEPKKGFVSVLEVADVPAVADEVDDGCDCDCDGDCVVRSVWRGRRVEISPTMVVLVLLLPAV